MLDDPFFESLEGAFAQGGHAGVVDEFEEAVEGEEDGGPGALGFGLGFGGGVAEDFVAGILAEVEFVDGEVWWDGAYGAVADDDGERGDHGARPCGDFIEMEVEPFGEEDDFGWDGGDGVVADLAEGGEVEFGIGVAAFGTAEVVDELAGLEHMGSVGVVAEEFEGEVAFDGGAEIGGGTGVLDPGAILGALEGAEVVGDFG